MFEPQTRVPPSQVAVDLVVVDTRPAPCDDLRVAVGTGMTGVIDRRRFFDRKDMDPARMVPRVFKISATRSSCRTFFRLTISISKPCCRASPMM